MKTFKEFLQEAVITNQSSYEKEKKEALQIAKKFNWDLEKVAKHYEGVLKKLGYKRPQDEIDLESEDSLTVNIEGSAGHDTVFLAFDAWDKTVDVQKHKQ